MYDLYTKTACGKFLVATFTTLAEALAVRNGYLACGTDVWVTRR